MALSAPLTIPFESGLRQKGRTLQDDVQQIVKQRGAFRHIAEETLLSESTKSDDANNDAQSEVSDELETLQATRETLFATNAEITKLLQASLNEINTLQDLTSWALSGRSKVAQTTMSPALKSGVPIGSGDVKTIPPPYLSRNAKQRLDKTSNIVRLQAFEKCSEKLMVASTRLETEAEHQSNFWEQMAQLRSRGWPISRLPRDGRSLVAHVASAESGLRYRNKGLIPLRTGEHGDLTLPETQKSGRRRRLAVSVKRQGKITGYFQDQSKFSEKSSPLEGALAQAKQSVFEEEAFDEASKEAQLIANMGAKVRSSSIDLDVTPECSISITYLPESSQEHIVSHADDDIAAFVSNGLRIMLIGEHLSKYRARSEGPPPPMTVNPRATPESIIIRPLLAQIRHHVDMLPLLESLRAYGASLERADLSLDVSTAITVYNDSSAPTLRRLRQITRSTIKIGLPSGRALDLIVETQLAAPRFGTQYTSTDYSSECGKRTLSPTSSLKAAGLFVADILARDICWIILRAKHSQNEIKWKIQTTSPLSLILVEAEEPRASLVASCHGGSVAISFLYMKTEQMKRAIFSGTKTALLHEDGTREEAETSLEDLVQSWMKLALKP